MPNGRLHLDRRAAKIAADFGSDPDDRLYDARAVAELFDVSSIGWKWRARAVMGHRFCGSDHATSGTSAGSSSCG